MTPSDGSQIGGSPLHEQKHWTRKRRELLQWFEDRVPSFVIGYEGAVEILNMSQLPGRVHFVCHAVRDIYRFLPGALGAKSLPRPVDIFPDMVTKLAELWQSYPPTGNSSVTGTGTDVLVSSKVYKYVSKIVQKRIAIGVQAKIGQQLAVALFRSSERREDEFIPPWVMKAFDEEYDFFVKRAHLAASVGKVPSDDGLIQHFDAFETAFHSLVGPYFSGKEELDAILQETNTVAD